MDKSETDLIRELSDEDYDDFVLWSACNPGCTIHTYLLLKEKAKESEHG